MPRNLIKIWVAKYEAGGLDSEADVLADYEARIAALERLVGKLALENEFLRGPRGTFASREARAHPLLPARWSLSRRRMPADGAGALDILRRPREPAH